MSSICNMNDRSRWHIYLPLYWWNVMKRRAKKGRRTDKNQRNDDKKVKIMSCWEDVCLCLCVLYIAKWRLPGFWSIVIRHRSWQISSTNKNVYLRKSLCICSSVCLCVCVERNHRVYLMCVCVFLHVIAPGRMNDYVTEKKNQRKYNQRNETFEQRKE